MTDGPPPPHIRTWEDQLLRQEELEDLGLSKGRDRFLKALRKAEEKGRRSQVGGVHSLLLKSLERIEQGVVAWIAQVSTQRGTRPIALQWLPLLEPDVLAYLTIKVLLDGLHAPRSLHSLAQAVAQHVEDELVYRKLREERPALFQYLTSKKFLTQHYHHNQRMLKGAVKANLVDVSGLRMTKHEKIHVGTKLIDLALTTTGLFRAELVHLQPKQGAHKLRRNARRDQWQILAEPDTLAWVDRKNDLLQWMHPVALPMVVPPLPWAPGQDGGYRFGLRGKYEMVRGVSPEQQQAVRKAEMPSVYAALNHIQSTAWCIDAKVLETIEAIAEQGGGLAGIPLLEPEPLPAKPHDIATNREARRAWRKLAHEATTRNVIRMQEALAWKRVVREADLLREEPTLFFPHNLDFRGRVYPVASHLSPQGDDLSKALLRFAEGKPLGTHGAFWLSVHGANCMDTDPDTEVKLVQRSLSERSAWVLSNEQAILRSAEDPLRFTWWAKADKPVQFLAFCFEWARFVECDGDPGMVSSLRVSIDGSCNGLQHFSALFRDEVGGSAVNLVPAEVPQDIYQRVADSVARACRAVRTGDPDYLLARRWLASGLLGRKLAKRPTMTFGYGSKVFGFQDQLIEHLSVDLRDTWERTKAHFTFDGKAQTLQACRWLARRIWEALEANVVKAFEGMDWLQRCAREVIRASGQPVTWTAPGTGFPVRQEYFKTHKRAIATILAGRVIKPRLYESTGSPLAIKQVNGISPNVIHSLDAAVLALTAERAMREGIVSFGAVHDSFGTVAGDMADLARITRETFVDYYDGHDVVAHLKGCFEDQAATPMPDAPKPGKLALRDILHSRYFFA